MNVDINMFFFHFSLHLPNYKVWGKELYPAYFYNDSNLIQFFFILGWDSINFLSLITPSIYYNPSSISCFYLFSECSLQGRNPQRNMLYRVCYQTDLGLYGVILVIDCNLEFIWFTFIIWKSRAECTDAGGKKDGTCADGFGVCCVSKY